MNIGILNRQISQVSKNDIRHFDDQISIEEPLQISISIPSKKISGKDISITMRTPGMDENLAIGFLFTEDIIRKRSEIIQITESKNQITIDLEESTFDQIKTLDRHFYANSSCGVCGKTSIDQLYPNQINYINPSKLINAQTLFGLPEKLRLQQKMFEQTGGIHAAALFDMNGVLLKFCEDVGRHNALDKLIGYYLLEDSIPLKENILLLSGRASFELIQKAVRAGIQYIAAIGAPSSLAVELAEKYKLTLIGFLKKDRFNIYSREDLVQYEN